MENIELDHQQLPYMTTQRSPQPLPRRKSHLNHKQVHFQPRVELINPPISQRASRTRTCSPLRRETTPSPAARRRCSRTTTTTTTSTRRCPSPIPSTTCCCRSSLNNNSGWTRPSTPYRTYRPPSTVPRLINPDSRRPLFRRPRFRTLLLIAAISYWVLIISLSTNPLLHMIQLLLQTFWTQQFLLSWEEQI